MTQDTNPFEQEIEETPAWLVFPTSEDKRLCLRRFIDKFGVSPKLVSLIRVETRDNGIWVGPIGEWGQANFTEGEL